MRREALKHLKEWFSRDVSVPLILGGARQVGKTSLVRLFAESENLDLLELNLEVEKLRSLNKDEFNLQELLDEIQLKKNKKIADRTLLFFDEIQESPKLLKVLRYFHEEKPQMAVISAGSMLELTFSADNFSFPVGRVEFYHLGPMNFREFLWAVGQDVLDEKLSNFDFSDELHEIAIKHLKDYYFVGGMPRAVKTFAESKSLTDIRRIQQNIVQTYQADFPKYNKRINIQRIDRVFNSLTLWVGKKIIYSKLDKGSYSRDIKRIVELLIDAKVVLNCVHSEGGQAPLLGQSDPRIFKTYFLDVGLFNAIMQLDFDAIDLEFKNNFNTKGVMAEQFVAQHLNFFQDPAVRPRLTYHLRDKGSQKAEVGFLIEAKNKIYPVEVKASAKGHLKSLKLFCQEKNVDVCIKTSLQKFCIEQKFAKKTRLATLPLYSICYLKDNLDKLN